MARPRSTRKGLRRLVEDYGADASAPEPFTLTVARSAAYTLSLGWPRQAVTRATLRACCPPADNVDDRLIHALRYFESREWCAVGKVAIFVNDDREVLREYAVRGYESAALRMQDFINVPQALIAIDGITSGSDGERALRWQNANGWPPWLSACGRLWCKM